MDSVQRIGVVTVTYNSAEVLPEFLESISRQTFREFLLYVVDNASKDASIELASAYGDSRIRIIANTENVGVAEGNNQGIRAALADNCDAVLLLNNDTVFPADTFEKLCGGLAEHQCSMTTPKIYYHDLPNTIWAAGGYFQPWLAYRNQHYGSGQIDRGQFDAVRTVTYAPTCCVLIHKDVFSRIGLMDPLYFVYVDDVDFMYRALKAGFIMKYLPQCTLQHKVSSLTGGTVSNFNVRYGTRNRVYYMMKNLSLPIAVSWTAIYGLMQYARHLAGIDSEIVWHLKLTALREGARLGKMKGPSIWLSQNE